LKSEMFVHVLSSPVWFVQIIFMIYNTHFSNFNFDTIQDQEICI